MPNYIYYRTQLPSLVLLNNSFHRGNNCSFSHGLTGHMLSRISGSPLQKITYFCAFWVWSEHNLSTALAVRLSVSNATALGGCPPVAFVMCHRPLTYVKGWQAAKEKLVHETRTQWKIKFTLHPGNYTVTFYNSLQQDQAPTQNMWAWSLAIRRQLNEVIR